MQPALIMLWTVLNPAWPTGSALDSTPPMHALVTPIAEFVASRQAEFDQINTARKSRLQELAAYIRTRQSEGQPAQLVFVCTHNSRRSQMAQLWAAVAAQAWGIRAETYSGGTESTAFNPRAVAAMERAGFRVQKTNGSSNPIYHVTYAPSQPPQTCFSKKFNGAPNPQREFAAVMVCSDADESCPVVRGAAARFAIPYLDPKMADGTSEEAAAYDERCAQIAREMLYTMSTAAGDRVAARAVP